MKYAKPATTFEEQADQLLRRGMVGDRATMIARLAFVNYYRFSAYWWPFRNPGPTPLDRLDGFVEGTEFETACDHYVFDQRLRVLVMEAIERIEVATRTQLAYHHAHVWGPDAYATDAASVPATGSTYSDASQHRACADDNGSCRALSRNKWLKQTEAAVE